MRIVSCFLRIALVLVGEDNLYVAGSNCHWNYLAYNLDLITS